jgi:multiple sugar transport system permease protein
MWFGTNFFNNLNHLFKNNNFPIVSGLINSFIVAASVTVLTVYFSTMTAYGIHAYNFKTRNIAFGFILMILMIPAQVSTAGFLKEMGAFKMLDTFWPLIIPAIAAPSTVFFMRQYMQGALPLEIVEAARIDGGNEFYNFNRIVLPILKPAMAVQAIFAFISTWNNYFTPAMVINSSNKKTVPIIIAAMRGSDYMNQDYGMIYATLFVSIIPLIIIYLIFSKYIIRGVALGSVKG